MRPDPLPHADPSAPAHADRKEYSTTVAVKIKLARFGKIREPFYRIVVADARTRRSGRAIENIGLYHPKAEPERHRDRLRARAVLARRRRAADRVRCSALLKVTGDWQKFKGLPGAEGTLKPQPVKADKRALYEAAIGRRRRRRRQLRDHPEARSARAGRDVAADGHRAAESADAS